MVIAGVVAVICSVSVYAAIIATLSSTHARPGDSVLLLTDDRQGKWNYDGLSSENRQPIYLAPTTSDPAAACGGPLSRRVGRLEWRGNAAGVSFIVPDLPLADYWLFMETRGQCWRIGGMVDRLAAPLVLSIGTIPADNENVAKQWSVESLGQPHHPRPQAPEPVPLLPTIAGAIFVAALLAAVGILWRRRRLSR